MNLYITFVVQISIIFLLLSEKEPEDGAEDKDEDFHIQYQDWLDDELSNFNDDDNDD